MIRFTFFLAVLAFAIFCPPATAESAASSDTVTLFLTANLNGLFATAIEDQHSEDPLLVMAQSLQSARDQRPPDLYLDLGNAFYPGILSRYSCGSLMMDYLNYTACAATLVSSQDLNIGVSNLIFSAKDRKTLLVSSNIRENGRPVFTPYFTRNIRGKKFAFIGLTSKRSLIDIAEKQLMDVTFQNTDAALGETLELLKSENPDHIVLLSGLSQADNLALLAQQPDLSLVISGGDTTGELYSAKANRVDVESGQSLITLTDPAGFYTLSLASGKSLSVDRLEFTPARPRTVLSTAYDEFVQRLTLWKKRFASEGEQIIVENVPEGTLMDAERAAELLRDRFRAEIAVVEDHSITRRTLSGQVTYSDILGMVNNGYPIYVYTLSGAEIRQAASRKHMVITGFDGTSVQGYSISDSRFYRVCSPQSVYDLLASQAGREIKYHNTWESLSDIIRVDLQGGRTLLKDDFGYLDERYRVLTDVYLSNFYNQTSVSRGEDIDIPPGKPADTYRKWGMEDRIDITLYNRHHKFVFTPYIYLIRQDDDYLQNLLRGTLLYTYNLYPHTKPYHKTQVDTVVVKTDNFRPILIRDTLGALFETEHFSGKVGLGIEKQTQDPEKPLFTGLETIVDADYLLWGDLVYTFHFDTFFSVERIDFGNRQIRSEVTNALSYRLNSFLALTLKHKWFYFYSFEFKDRYTDSQTLLGLDLMTGFKLY